VNEKLCCGVCFGEVYCSFAKQNFMLHEKSPEYVDTEEPAVYGYAETVLLCKSNWILSFAVYFAS